MTSAKKFPTLPKNNAILTTPLYYNGFTFKQWCFGIFSKYISSKIKHTYTTAFFFIKAHNIYKSMIKLAEISFNCKKVSKK